MGICGNETIINKAIDEKLNINTNNNIIFTENYIKTIENKNMKVNELFTGHKPIPMEIAIKAMKSICKIRIKTNEGIKYGTGFFLKISDSLKYLFTNYHVINKNTIKIEIEMYNKRQIELNLRDYFIKYFDEPKDITAIYIKDLFDTFKDIEFLDYDLNYIKGYSIYKNIDVFSLENPYGKNTVCASGIIKDIVGYEFYHDISTDNGSSGCPIILLNNNLNSLQVIGIHKYADYYKKLNCGTFIGEIINELKYEIKDILNNNFNEIKEINPKINEKDIPNEKLNENENKNEIIELNQKNEIIKNDNNIINNNYIIGKINLEDKKIIPISIQIIYSYDEYMRDHPYFITNPELKNENEIKKCEIKINDELIPFNYYYEFKKRGKYSIKYSFPNYLTNTSCLFYRCEYLKSLDLANFKTQNVIYMESMFNGCDSLKNIDLSNFNTQNVKNMRAMFCGCNSLKSIDLSSFDTHNVYDMSFMFEQCYKLSNLNLTNFNTRNVIYMQGMCIRCWSLKKLDLSNFNTQNVIYMYKMFAECGSLKKLDLSNFNTQKIISIEKMFDNCNSLEKSNLLTEDDRIIKQYISDYRPDNCDIF